MKKASIIAFFLFTALFLYAQTLSWDIKFLRGRNRESVPISQIIRMETGQNFQIAITPAVNSFCYVIVNDSSRQIFVLHDQPIRAGNEINLGPLRLEEPSGTETLYVIMSLERQTSLENLIQSHKSNPQSRQHTDNLRREIVRLQSVASALGEPASIFIPSGGTTRGSTQEHATRFSGQSLYVRTIAVRH